MGKFGEERFADQLVLSLADESTAVRLAAINAIVRHRPQTGLGAAHQLARRSRHLDPHRRGAGARRVSPPGDHRAAAAPSDARPAAGAHRRDRGARQVGGRAGQGRALPLSRRVRSGDPARGDAGAGAHPGQRRVRRAGGGAVARRLAPARRRGGGPRRCAAIARRCRRCIARSKTPTPTCSSRRFWRSTRSRIARRSRISSRRWRTRAILDDVSEVFVRHAISIATCSRRRGARRTAGGKW